MCVTVTIGTSKWGMIATDQRTSHYHADGSVDREDEGNRLVILPHGAVTASGDRGMVYGVLEALRAAPPSPDDDISEAIRTAAAGAVPSSKDPTHVRFMSSLWDGTRYRVTAWTPAGEIDVVNCGDVLISWPWPSIPVETRHQLHGHLLQRLTRTASGRVPVDQAIRNARAAVLDTMREVARLSDSVSPTFDLHTMQGAPRCMTS